MGDATTEDPGRDASALIDEPWAHTAADVTDALGIDADLGLSDSEAEQRREQYGPNRLREIRPPSVWKIFVDQIDDLVIAFLVVTAAVALVLGYWIEGIAVGFVVLVTTTVGMVMELRARRSMQALLEMGQVSSTVLREGRIRSIPADTIVPGDVVLLDEGDVISADLRLLETSRLQVSEAALTGESLPTGKDRAPVAAETVLAERKNMLFSGTAITRGTGRGVVVATGMDTELGEVSALVEESDEVDTPLEKRLNRLASRLIWITLALSSLVFPAGLWAGQPVELIATTAIALAIATVPEGLPVVATLTLARGMVRMARQNALMRRLASVETLGATTLICTDKTGTLTENRMAVDTLLVAGRRLDLQTESSADDDLPPQVHEAIRIGLLCNNAYLQSDDDGESIGDPMEVALLNLGRRFGLSRSQLVEETPEVREVAFDSVSKMMATFHEEGRKDGDDQRFLVAVKGAPEVVLNRCVAVRQNGQRRPMTPEQIDHWRHANDELAGQGLRLLALATRRVDDLDSDPYEDLLFVGLIAFSDPPRADVAEAIEKCRRAGIRVVMVTGDQLSTARHIADKIGLTEDSSSAQAVEAASIGPPHKLSTEARRQLLDASIFARVSPRQKLDLIDLHQQDGQVVAMTGDGVNDAPALTHADIGVAMGLRGTDVARQASDLILRDDRFATIVRGIEEGRLIFTNIRRFVVFLLSINFASILAITIASLLGAPIPVTPLQILYLNMLTDLFPALALVTTGGAAFLMDQPPRPPKEPLLTRRHWLTIGAYGALLATAVLASLAIALTLLEYPPARAITVSFLTLGLAKALHALNMRENKSLQTNVPLPNPVLRNKSVWAAIALCVALLATAVYLPWLSNLLDTVGPDAAGWAVVAVLGVTPLVPIQLVQFVAPRARTLQEVTSVR